MTLQIQPYPQDSLQGMRRVARRTGLQVPANTIPLQHPIQPLSELPPAQPGDSGAPNMQHMAVVRDFVVP